MADAPGPSTTKPFKRKLTGPFSNHSKRLRCGPNSYMVVGSTHDPLNLEADDNLVNNTNNVKNDEHFKNKKKRRKHDSENDDNLFTPVFVSQRTFSLVQQKLKQQHLSHQHHHLQKHTEKKKNDKTIKNNLRYRFGNFNRYYGNRPQLAIPDHRLNYLIDTMFNDMDVLDIGCNSGLLTISIAKFFKPTKITGIDIDEHLIKAAKQNIRYFCDKDYKLLHRFPASFSGSFGPISAPIVGKSAEFPHNLEFICENYVLEKDEDLYNVESEYDVILCFGTLKWIHLNFGDDGIKRVFKKMYAQLKPKGKLLLEPSDFKSYKKSSKSCSILQRNYENIRFKPEDFRDYLLSSEVGFQHCEDVGISFIGFSGPLYILYKDNVFQQCLD